MFCRSSRALLTGRFDPVPLLHVQKFSTEIRLSDRTGAVIVGGITGLPAFGTACENRNIRPTTTIHTRLRAVPFILQPNGSDPWSCSSHRHGPAMPLRTDHIDPGRVLDKDLASQARTPSNKTVRNPVSSSRVSATASLIAAAAACANGLVKADPFRMYRPGAVAVEHHSHTFPARS